MSAIYLSKIDFSPEKLVVELRGAALDLLGRREYSRRELAGKLAQRFGLPQDQGVLQDCLDRLASDGYQSDARFAEVFVRSRRARGYGPVFIEQELRQRGIDSELIRTVVDRADAGWSGLAAELKRKKFGQGRVTAVSEKAKVVRFLRYRGFLQAQVEAALQRHC